MNELDYLLLIIVVVGAAIGLRRGLIRVLISTVGIYLAVIVAGYAYRRSEEHTSELQSR